MVYWMCIFGLSFDPHPIPYDIGLELPIEMQNNYSEGLMKRGAAGKFNFMINCLDLDDDKCAMAREEAFQVATSIEQTMDISTEINMAINFVSFCRSSCSNSTIARTGPTNYFSALANRYMLYPQALAKQLSDVDLGYTMVDAVINFNMDRRDDNFKFYFETRESSDEGLYSFKFILIHELTHGLGIVNSFDSFTEGEAGLLSPSPAFRQLFSREFTQRYRVQSNSPFPFINIYDSLLEDARTNTPLIDFYRAHFYNASVPLSSDTFNAAQSLHMAATSRFSVVFNAGSEKIPVDSSFAPFNDGSSLSHIDPSVNSDSLDELMYAFASTRSVNSYPGHDVSPFGRSQILILQAMGYTFQIDAEAVPTSSAMSILPMWLLLVNNCLFYLNLFTMSGVKYTHMPRRTGIRHLT